MQKSNKKVLAVIFSDLHLDRWKKFNEHNRRTKNGLDVLKRLRLVAKKYNAIQLFLGDMFHKERGISNALLEDTLPYFGKLYKSDKYKTYAITGNHDQSEQNTIKKPSPSYINTLSKTFAGIECIDFKSVEFENFIIYGVPYLTHDLGLLEYLDKLKVSKNKVNILMLHTTLPGAKDTNGSSMESYLTSNELEKVLTKFDIVLCGHIHKPMEWGIAKTTVIQVGAPQQQRLTDKDCEMGYWLMYDNFDLKFIPFKNYPKFKTIKPGVDIPKDGNFYVLEQREKVSRDSNISNSFNVNLEKKKLARNYCKEKGIKDKKKKRSLREVLNKTTT